MDSHALQTEIDELWERRDTLSSRSTGAPRDLVEQVLEALDTGHLRVAEAGGKRGRRDAFADRKTAIGRPAGQFDEKRRIRRVFFAQPVQNQPEIGAIWLWRAKRQNVLPPAARLMPESLIALRKLRDFRRFESVKLEWPVDRNPGWGRSRFFRNMCHGKRRIGFGQKGKPQSAYERR